MVVYVDLIFILNFLMDGSMLFTTAKIRKLKIVWWRLLLSSAIGASYVVMMFLPQLSFLYTFIVKIGFSLVMVSVAFKILHWRHLWRNLAIFYVVNFVAAGGIIGVRYLLQNSSEVINGILFSHSGGAVSGEQIGVVFIVLVACLMLLLLRKVFASQKRREQVASFLAEVEVRIDSHVLTCTGLIDTGNQLYDPLTRRPVMIMEAGRWEGYLPAEWVERIRSADADRLIADYGQQSDEWQDRLRLVPYRGVNRHTQFMLAVKPDQVIVTYEGRRIATDKVLIGLDGGTLSHDHTYHAIIHPALMEINQASA